MSFIDVLQKTGSTLCYGAAGLSTCSCLLVTSELVRRLLAQLPDVVQEPVTGPANWVDEKINHVGSDFCKIIFPNRTKETKHLVATALVTWFAAILLFEVARRYIGQPYQIPNPTILTFRGDSILAAAGLAK